MAKTFSSQSSSPSVFVWVVAAIVAVGVGYSWLRPAPAPNFATPKLLNQKDFGSFDDEELAGVPKFDPGYILHDESFASTRAFGSAESVQTYLERQNSILATYVDRGTPASEWIWQASRGATSSQRGITPQLNPGLLIALLEKEQSLISLARYDTAADPEKRLRAATGYACPDNDTCDSQYYGFATQINSAAYQLQKNFDEARSGVGVFVVGQTIETLDNYQVTLANAATAAVYRYTPHVYWGNYNLWKIITANGWGVSPQTYSLQAIDRRNVR